MTPDDTMPFAINPAAAAAAHEELVAWYSAQLHAIPQAPERSPQQAANIGGALTLLRNHVAKVTHTHDMLGGGTVTCWCGDVDWVDAVAMAACVLRGVA